MPSRVVAHERLRQVGAVGRPVDIPRFNAEHLAEIGEIGGALGRIVGAEVGAGGGELAVAGFGRGQMGALGCLGIEAEAEKLSGEVVAGRAGQRRFREHGAALADHIDVAVADEVGGDKPVDLQRGDVARPAGQIDNRVGPLLRRASGYFATMSRMVRPFGRLRFSGTTRYPQLALASSSAPCSFGHGAGSKRGTFGGLMSSARARAGEARRRASRRRCR